MIITTGLQKKITTISYFSKEIAGEVWKAKTKKA